MSHQLKSSLYELCSLTHVLVAMRAMDFVLHGADDLFSDVALPYESCKSPSTSSMPAPTLLVVQMLPYRPRVARRLAAVMGLIRYLRKTHGNAEASVFHRPHRPTLYKYSAPTRTGVLSMSAISLFQRGNHGREPLIIAHDAWLTISENE